MKIKMQIEFEVPGVDNFSDAEISQLLFDAYTHYTTCKHLEDAMKWCARGRIGMENEDSGAKQIYQYHNTWADICKGAEVKYEINR